MRFFSSHLDLSALHDDLTGLGAPATGTHLAACARCRAERDRLRISLDRLAAAASSVADDAMPAVLLDRQRHAIQDRIGRLGTSARLLAFPSASSPRPVEVARPNPRWIAAAAVAGLLVGVAVGRVQLDLNDGSGSPGAAVQGAPRAAAEPLVGEVWRDDPLLSDVDAVLTRETRPEFEALDGLTPISDEGR